MQGLPRREDFGELFTSQRISRIYLDELGEITSLPVGIATIKLVLEDKDTAIVSARELINRTQQEINTGSKQRQLLELIETILVYKFPTMSREEIESMFGLSELKQTIVYQEAKQEGIEEGRQRGIAEANLNAISGMLMLGLTIEQITQALNLDIEQVRNAAQQAKTQNDR
ncbi:Rpn family recombination-promoting nuclease/putative transposase [Calothrix anomala FACHB-343]|uniref:Rpn family recombination-promoting nuclease/putative transposase n=2 Tax=Calothrix TaxID=1186 RepID=A0ABR8AE63_9CYAN|nr:Rpn family recombination-promoting nuclease/putative transposase [Calothrix parietina FACHB-288]MBD2226531.1 Rpn family recombination-promoting nuclease/putative transposase [Calothrix anomala FACHB-343]